MTPSKLRRRSRSERGSTLIFVLCMIIVLAVSGAAVLKQIQSSPAVQDAYSGDRTLTFSAEGTTDTLINKMRSNANDGIDNGNGGTCSDSTTWKQISTNVFCKPDFMAGRNIGLGGDSPPFSIMALGGSVWTGNRKAGIYSPPIPTSFVNGSAAGTSDAYAPFCDNYHDYQDQTTTSRCEAGLFVGRAVKTDDGAPGGLNVVDNGNVTSAPQIRSNGSIVLSDAPTGGGQVTFHTLTAAGLIQSRRDCGWGHGYLDTNGIAPGALSVEVRGGADTAHLSGQPGYTDCNSDNPAKDGTRLTLSTTPNIWTNATTNWLTAWDPKWIPSHWAQATLPVTNTCKGDGGPGDNWDACMWTDPDWVHEPFYPGNSANPNDLSNVPRVDASAPPPYQLSPSLCSGRFVPMPALDTTPLTGKTMDWIDANKVAHSSHIYTAWYDSATDLSAFMDDPGCDDTLFWFRPGVYYFDFLDASRGNNTPPTKWTVPNGCIPIDACPLGRGSSEVVAGWPNIYKSVDSSITPKYGNSTQAGWIACDGSSPDTAGPLNVLACKQPWKPMFPDDFAFDQGNDPRGFKAANANGEIERMDTETGSISISSAFTNENVKSYHFTTPIPQQAGVNISTVNGLVFEVAYNLPSNHTPSSPDYCGPSVCYRDPSGAPDNHNDNTNLAGTANQGEGAELQISNGSGRCFIHLPTGNHLGLKKWAVTPYNDVWHAPTFPNNTGTIGTAGDQHTVTWRTGEAISIDLTNGCNSSVPGYERVNQGCPTITSTTCFPTAAGGWNARPDWVNALTAEFSARTSMPAGYSAKIELDGVQQNVTWSGRPAPSFPAGCDPVGAGVQWVFGNSSRLDWAGTGNDTYGELCANKQSWFPGVDPNASGANYGIGIYGMTEDMAGPPSVFKANTIPATNIGVQNPPNTSDQQFPQTPVWTPGMSGTSTYAKFATIDATRSTANATAAGPPDVAAGKSVGYEWKSKNALVLQYKLPSNIWSWVGTSGRPTGSFECGVTAPMSALNANDPPQVGAGKELPADGSCSSADKSIPYGSVITNVKVNVRHREGEWTAAPPNGVSGVPTSGNFVNCNVDQSFVIANTCTNTVKLSITNATEGIPAYGTPPPTVGSGSIGSNGMSMGNWATYGTSRTDDELIAGSLPLSDQTSSTGAGGWRDWVWGEKTGDETASMAAGNPSTSDWSIQRDLTDAMNSPEALTGAVINYTVTPRDNNHWHYAELDGIELEVTYRPPGSARPLSNCLTSRTAWPPSQLEGLGTAGAGTAGWSQDGGGNWAYNGGGHDWLDQDWGINKTNGGSPYVGDEALGNIDATGSGNGSVQGDKGDCALVNVDGSKNHTRFHVVGTVYMPSAGIALSGYSNNAPWVTDGILARQLSALRWMKGGDVAPIGDSEATAKFPRTANIVVCDNSQVWTPTSMCTGAHVQLRAKAQYDDTGKWGYASHVISWTREPGS